MRRQHARSGSILFLSLGIAAILLGIAFLFVKSMQLGVDSSRAEQREALARSAALYGLNDAFEQIALDYAEPATVHGSGSLLATTNDGPWRSYFVPHNAYDRNFMRRPSDPLTAPSNDDDSRFEDGMFDFYYGWVSDYQGRRSAYRDGYFSFNDQGRWIEPGFTGTTRAAAVRFTDQAPALPARSYAVFYDDDLRPLASGNVVADRARARYRLRYACGVEDLGGHPLLNPDSDYDYRQLWTLERKLWDGAATIADASATATPSGTALSRQEKRLQAIRRNAPAYFSMLTSGLKGDAVPSAMAEHTWLGRGSATGCARGPNSTPQTYSFMWRTGKQSTGSLPAGPGGLYTADGVRDPSGDENGNRNWSMWARYLVERNGPSENNLLGETLVYQHKLGQTAGTPLGGVDLKVDYDIPLDHNLIGAVYSPRAWRAAVNGRGSGWTSWSANVPNIPFLFSLWGRWVWTPETVPIDPAGPHWAAWKGFFEDNLGPVETPWYSNLLTVTPKSIYSMALAYFPSYLKTLNYTKEAYSPAISKNPNGSWNYGADPTATLNEIPPQSVAFGAGRDLHIPYVSPAFAAFKNPTMDGVAPNFHKPDPEIAYPNRPGYDDTLYVPAKRYPGMLWTGRYDKAQAFSIAGASSLPRFDSAWADHTGDPAKELKNEGEDDLGEYIAQSTMPTPRSPYSAALMLEDFGGDISRNRSAGGWKGTPPAWFNSDTPGVPGSRDAHSFRWILDPAKLKFANSYWWDIARAFAYTVAVTQAQWKQSSDVYLAPGAAAFEPDAAWDPAAYQSLRDIDYALLRQLGEIPEAPGSAATQAAKAFRIQSNSDGTAQVYYRDFNPADNIWTLTPDPVTAPSVPYPKSSDPTKGTKDVVPRVWVASGKWWDRTKAGGTPDPASPNDNPGHAAWTTKRFSDTNGDGIIDSGEGTPLGGGMQSRVFALWKNYKDSSAKVITQYPIVSPSAPVAFADAELVAPPPPAATSVDVNGWPTAYNAVYEFLEPLNVPGSTLFLPTEPAWRKALARSRDMEQVLNDFRTSFFGSSPQYYRTFRPMDFNGDGKVECSAYKVNAADGRRWRPLDLPNGGGLSGGYGPVIDEAAGDVFFNICGTFYLGKSRFYRIFVRGELFDNRLNRVAARSHLESVFCVDPDGNCSFTGPGASGLEDSQVLFQKWHFHALRASMVGSYP